MKNIKIEIEKEIPFYDLDPLNVVWHGNYVKYTELVRSALLDKIGYGYLEMANEGFAFPIAKMDMKFVKSATLAQKIKLCAYLVEFEPSLIIKYVFKNEADEIIFKASTMQICVDMKTHKTLYVLPENFKERINSYEEN